MKKLFTILLVLLLLCGCGAQNNNNTDDNSQTESSEIEDLGLYYLNQLKNYTVREKNSTLQDNQEFDAFLDKIFLQTVSDSYLFMIQSVEDFDSLGIEKPEVSLGHLSYEVDQEELDKTLNDLDELLSFDYDSLSLRQQYDYDMYHYSLLETLCGFYYSKYSLIFSEANSFSDNLMTLLMEFNMDSSEDEQDFLILLSLVPSYIDEAITYCDNQMENGLYHSDEMLNNEIDYLNTLIENNCSSLNETYKDFTISNEISDSITNYLVPSFTKLRDYLKGLIGKGDASDLALCNIDKNYAEYTYLINSSNNESIDTQFEDLVNYYGTLVQNFYDAYQNNNDILDEYQNYIETDIEPFNLSSEDVLEYLRNNISARYTYLDDINYVVSELDTLGNTTAGYFVTPPVDNPNRNVIRINANSSSSFSTMEVYEILAHEGFPGHLYQNAYYQRTNPHRFRATNTFVGYSEGYADLAAMDALKMLNYPDEDYYNVAILNSITFNSHILYSIMDLGVNYYGWDEDTLADKMDALGLSNTYAKQIYETVVSMPGVYARYALGYVSHLKLRNKAIEALNDKFDYVQYSNLILENGPLPFAILEGVVDTYINENK